MSVTLSWGPGDLVGLDSMTINKPERVHCGDTVVTCVKTLVYYVG